MNGRIELSRRRFLQVLAGATGALVVGIPLVDAADAPVPAGWLGDTLYGLGAYVRINGDGSVCWGTVKKVGPDALAQNNLAEDWAQMLGTPFGGHSVHGKCRSFDQDVRQLYVELERRRARIYPKKELVPEKRTLSSVIASPGYGGGEA